MKFIEVVRLYSDGFTFDGFTFNGLVGMFLGCIQRE